MSTFLIGNAPRPVYDHPNLDIQRTIDMGGGYISARGFDGEDKSGTAIGYVLKELQARMKKKRKRVPDDMNSVIRNVLGGEGPPADPPFELSAETCATILPFLESYTAELTELTGYTDHTEAPEYDQYESKWDGGPGWQLYCCGDLLKAIRSAMEYDEGVEFTFD